MPGTFERGFKAAAERLAVELRAELGLTPHCALDPLALARHLLVPVLSLTDVQAATPKEVWRFTRGQGRDEFFAATIYVGEFRRFILLNPSHSKERQHSDICHEIGHIILGHEPEVAKAGETRAWNARQEREADWLGASLLVPALAARRAAERGLSNAEVAQMFGVSVQLAAMRMNATGARIIARRKGA